MPQFDILGDGTAMGLNLLWFIITFGLTMLIVSVGLRRIETVRSERDALTSGNIDRAELRGARAGCTPQLSSRRGARGGRGQRAGKDGYRKRRREEVAAVAGAGGGGTVGLSAQERRQ